MRLSISAWLGLSSILLIAAISMVHSEPDIPIVKITAQRFHYTPDKILLKRGKPVILEFTSLDFTHGFSVPDLHLRADLPPGKITRIQITPEKTGSYDFLCDNFCGAGHDKMNGRIIVTNE